MPVDTLINGLAAQVVNFPGTAGDITVGSAAVGHQAFAAAHDGKFFSVVIEQGNDREWSTGCLYTHGTTTLSRGGFEASTTGTPLNLAAGAVVRVTMTADSGNRLLANTATSIAAAQLLDTSVANNGRGSLICDFSISPVNTVTTEIMPDTGATVVPRVLGATGQAYASTSAAQASDFSAVGFWARCAPRVDGTAYGYYRLDLGTDTTFANRALCAISLRADGKWRFYVVHSKAFGVAGTFTLGTTTFNAVRVMEQGGATTRPAANVADAVYLGPVYRNPKSRAFAFVRFDDCLADHYTPRITLATPYVGQSGVTVPSGVPLSGLSICNYFGLKATSYILTSCVGKHASFMTWDQLRDLQNRYGWCVAFQSHANPAALNNAGLRLLGPHGYAWSTNVGTSIASVDTTANTITTTTAHSFLTAGTGNAGLQGQPIIFYGPDLPSPLVAGTIYWPRPTSTTAFTLHATELDSATGANVIDLTTTGTVGTMGYRYSGATNDGAAILADFTTGQALMQNNGLRGWRHYAPNQGAYDTYTEAAVLTLRAQDKIRTVSAIFGSSGAASSQFLPRTAIGLPSYGIGFTGDIQRNTTLAEWINLPVAIGTESMTEADIRTYVDTLITKGAIGGNYHHYFSTEASARALIAYCDQIKLRVDQGLLQTGTMDDLYAALVAGGTV
jgi:hypothetical protein